MAFTFLMNHLPTLSLDGAVRANRSVNADARGRPLPSVALLSGAGYVRR